MPPGNGYMRYILGRDMEELIEKLKVKIIEILNLTDVKPADIPEDRDLMAGGLDIDSIDMLELVIMLRKDYGVHIKNKEQAKQVFASLRSLAAYILETSPGLAN